ncbi:MAG: methionine adenosyltransferase [Alphaproteobacteria bacterium]|nr:methionine adenosyltransferase [Alphaproteobacteria bacterium]
MKDYLFASESVSAGHPDKVADQISDALVDLFLSKDSQARCAIETLVTVDKVVLAGEISCLVPVSNEEIEHIVRQEIRKIGYTQKGFHFESVSVLNFLHTQSRDIALGVDTGGAGDQGIMFGYAVNEGASEYMPMPLYLSHRLLEELTHLRQKGKAPFLLPDGKSQFVIRYNEGTPVGVDSVVVSNQHTKEASLDEIKAVVLKALKTVLPKGWSLPENKVYVNPTGRFVIGGPVGDTGLTGRKIIVDTYGGAAPHGGGAFSGKDPSKVDRSAAYMTRYLAKNIVASSLADKCLIELSYAIGMKEPLSLYLDTFGTGRVSEEKIIKTIQENIDLTPNGIREKLSLNRPIYEKTASFGHFGRKALEDGSFSWEKLDLMDIFQKC